MKIVNKTYRWFLFLVVFVINFNLQSIDSIGLAKTSTKWIEFIKSPEGEEVFKLMGAGVTVLADDTIVITKTLVDGTVTASKIFADGTVQASSKIGLESVKEFVRLGEKCLPLAWGGLALVAVGEGYFIIRDIRNISAGARAMLNPSNKDASEDLKYEEEFNLRKAKKDLRESLLKNAKGERGASGLPVACEEGIRKLIIAGGEAELEQLANAFKKCYEGTLC